MRRDAKDESSLHSSDIILLTGAGFTKTFGGYLGSEMWARIFNHFEIQQNPKIRNRMLRDLNFESVYSKVVESREFSRIEKRSLTTAIRKAYKSMRDKVLSENVDLINNATGACKAYISKFAGSIEKRGFVFTLNQDQFIERWFTDVGGSVMVMPGIERRERWFYPGSGPWIDNTIELPKRANVKQIISNFYNRRRGTLVYIKLHGSYGWRSAVGGQRGDLMIIGRTKSELINKEPLLKWYFSLFEDVLSRAKKLVVIGYGFGDEHINKVVVKNRAPDDLRYLPLRT
jgi:hypothetical protein